jgi:Protein of unknown function (DUF3037)
MPDTHTYDYAVIRVVPSVDRGEFINCGVILYARTLKFLGALIELDQARLLGLDPHADIEEIRSHLDIIPGICAGDTEAGPIAALTQSERFNWLVAPRSAVIQMSPVHTGITTDPAASLQKLMASMVTIGR